MTEPQPTLTQMISDTISHRPTPYLTVNLQMVKDAYHALQRALPQASIFYAVKSNPHPDIVRCIDIIGGSFEIASATEMEELIHQGLDPVDMLFTNPVKMPDHIRRAWNAGVWRFSFDSLIELEKIAGEAPGAAVLVRLQAPRFNSSVASEGKFGINGQSALQLMRQAKNLGLKPYGIAFHVGSQMESPQPWRPAIQSAAKLMRQLQDEGIQLEMLDIGGGFPAFYGQSLPDISEYGACITKALKEFLPYKVRIVTEPGRFLVANAGMLTATVIGKAERGGKLWRQ